MPRILPPSTLLLGALCVSLACVVADASPEPVLWSGTDGGRTDDGAAESSDTGADDGPREDSTTSGSSGDAGDVDGADTGPPADDGTSDGIVPVHPCCAPGEAPGCGADPEVEACVCATIEGAECCTDGWDERCIAVMEHYACAPTASPCGAPTEAVPWDCDCTTTNVTCIDNPFVSQVTFFEDACSPTHLEALAYVDAYCVSGDRECMGAPGSCECECRLDDSPPPNACEE